jgi:hypothetical protein
MRTVLALSVAALAALALAAPAVSGVGGPAFYVDGTVYRTVGTPTDLTGTGAPAHSFDTIYEFFGEQPLNVSTVGPGTPGYNGGRWTVTGLSFADYDAAVAAHDANGSGDFDSAAEVEAAIGSGAATAFDTGVRFVCPVIKLAQGG